MGDHMNIFSKKYYEWKLNRMQDKVNKEYDEKGFTDEILEKQIKINKKRHKLNISDPNQPHNDEGFVQ